MVLPYINMHPPRVYTCSPSHPNSFEPAFSLPHLCFCLKSGHHYCHGSQVFQTLTSKSTLFYPTHLQTDLSRKASWLGCPHTSRESMSPHLPTRQSTDLTRGTRSPPARPSCVSLLLPLPYLPTYRSSRSMAQLTSHWQITIHFKNNYSFTHSLLCVTHWANKHSKHDHLI